MPFKLKNSSLLVIGILITLFIGIAIFVRTYYTYNAVFVGDWIKLTSNDAYYQMRLVDIIAHNFPHMAAFDPYLIFPGGASYGPIHFFSWLIAFVVWVVTLGNPTQHAIDMVGVYFPVILAALAVIPVYFMGKALFNRWAGVIAAGMMAVLPGEFVGRSILGGTDQHVAETLFSAVAAMFIIFALRAGWQNKISWDNLFKRDWKPLLKPLLYSILAGVFMGIYLITWEGALLFVFIIMLYFIVQFIIDHFKGQSSFYLGFIGFFIFLTALIIYSPIPYPVQKFMLIALVFVPPALAIISRLLLRPGIKAFFYPLALVGVAAAALVILWAVNPYFFKVILSMFSMLNPGGPTGTTTIEMQPFLSPNGTFNIAVAWGNFTTSFFLIPWAPIPGLAIIALVVLIVLFIKRRSDEKHMLFFFIWTLVILLATIMQRRFAYYLVVNMALLTSYLAWQFIWWFSKRRNNLELDPETLASQYRRSRFVGVLGGLIAFGLSFLLVGTMYFFIPVFMAGLLSIFYGFWAWVKLKGLNDYMILWAFLFPIGIPILAFMEEKKPKTTAAKDGARKKQINFAPAAANAPVKVEVKAKSKVKEVLNPWLYGFNTATLVVLVFVAVFWPNYTNAKQVATAATFAPSNAWEETLHWLKDNTPEPMDPGNFYAINSVPAGGAYVYPDTAYGVTSWWDYGYWITRTAQRLPSDNPSQAPEPIKKVANLFVSVDDQQAAGIMKSLNSSYVVLDSTMTTSKIWAVMVWAGIDSSKYVQQYYYANGNQLVPIEVYTTEYYKLFSVRLFNFNGKASTSEKPMVLTWKNQTVTGGATVRLVSNAEEFDSYQAALDYVNAHPDENVTIAGSSPFVNPIPITAVPGFDLVFTSTMNDAAAVNAGIAEVKVFHYSGN